MQDEFLFQVHEGDKCALDHCLFEDKELTHELDTHVWRSKSDGKIRKFHASCWEVWYKEIEQPILQRRNQMALRYDNNGNPREGDDNGDFLPPDPTRRAWYVACAVVFLAICCILALPQVG